MNASSEPVHGEPIKMYQTMTVQAMVFGFILLAGLWAIPTWLWQGPKSIHIALEFIAALLALVVGLGSIVRFVGLGQRIVLVFGLSFLAAGLTDLINAAVSLDVLSSGHGEDPTTWTAGRLIHGFLLLASLVVHHWIPNARKTSRELVGGIIAVVVFTGVTMSIVSSFSDQISSTETSLFRQMAEWSLVLLFFWSAWGYLQLHLTQRSVFYDWAAAAAVVFGVAQIYAALFLNWRESSVNIPHALKVFGYIAALTGLYMENLGLFKETERQRDALDVQNRSLARTNRELDSLLGVSREIAETQVADRLPQLILNRAASLIPQAESSLLLLYDAALDRLIPKAAEGMPFDRLIGLQLQPDESFYGRVFTSGKVYVSASEAELVTEWGLLSAPNRKILQAASATFKPVVQTVCAPLIEHGTTIGLMVLNNHSADYPFSERQISFFQTLCNQVGGAIRNAQLYAQIQQYAKQLQTKNQELESFVYTASHDLRSPLVSLHGLMAMFTKSMGPKIDERGQRYLTRLEANVSQMEELIDGLLELARVGRSEVKNDELDMNRLIHDLVEQLRPQLERNLVTITVNPLPSLNGPAIQIKQVFGNLMSNAVKYMGDSEERRVEVGGHRDDNGTCFYVQDSGIGIDPAYHDKVFVIFQRLKELDDVKGTGVGLAIVKKIIDNLEGSIVLESQKGKGSRFTITLPFKDVTDSQKQALPRA